jgi:xanthine dehydrogenase accessory factor
MSELVSMLETLVAEVEAGRPVALCAVVATRGSAPQVPGATMLICADFSTRGTLGGGCVEAEVRRRAFELLQRGQSQLLDFNLNADYGWDDGIICGGQMTIAVQVLRASAFPRPSRKGTGEGVVHVHDDPRPALPLEGGGVAPKAARPANPLAPYLAALNAARQRQPAMLPLTVSQDQQSREYQLRLEAPPTLLIAGAGHIGQAVARLAVGLDFHVVALDDRAEYASPHRFPPGVQIMVGDIAGTLRDFALDEACYVVIVTRGHQHDRAALDAVVRRPAAYIGMIGSRRKSRLILDELAAAGVPADDLARVHTPIGVAIGAVTVPEIAVSIVAELVQVRRQRSGAAVRGPVTSDDNASGGDRRA